jgi:hypothetical protein
MDWLVCQRYGVWLFFMIGTQRIPTRDQSTVNVTVTVTMKQRVGYSHFIVFVIFCI